jgi:SWI/SNF-related matrix-associated actin-dependent regulator 1 of chromatin subfamily A
LSAKRTKAFKHLCRSVPFVSTYEGMVFNGVPHVIGLSGTPLTNRPAELWPFLNICRPDVFDKFYPYGVRYCKPERTPWGTKYNGAERLDELHDLLKSTCMIRRKKIQVLKDLPLKQRIVVPIDIEDRKQYVEAEKEFIRWMIRTHPQKAEKARRAERLVKMGYLKRLAAQLKMKAVREWIHNYLEESDSKLIVFGVHRNVLVPLTEHFGEKAVRVDGKITKNKRQEAFDAINGNPKVRILFGNIQAAGVGWSCKTAHTTLFTELAWTPGEHQQAEDRIHGIGRGVKGKQSTSFYLIAKGTIEERLAEILQHKQKILDSTLDGGEQVDALNILDALEEAMIRSKGAVTRG